MALNSDFINYQYDFTHLIGIEYPDNGSEPNIANVSYLYDGPTDDFPGRLVHQEDATGLQDFEYGSMGELTYSKRTVVGPNIPSRDFETEFEYDSWNRLLKITYPDGETVDYTYDKGGNLTKMTRDANGSPYNYIKEIKYDYYEQPTYIEYGNSTKMNYTYTADLRRLNNYKLRASNNNYLLNNTYFFDRVGNITSLANAQSFSSPTQLGGVYTHDFEYDVLNRLVDAEGSFTGNQLFHYNNGNDYKASYDLQMNYSDTHGITGKKQNHAINNTAMIATSYDHSYSYTAGSHKLEKIEVPGIDPSTGLYL